MIYTFLTSPVGRLLLGGEDDRLRLIRFPGERQTAESSWRRDDGAFEDARRQLTEYFAGQRRTFDLPLAPQATPFQAIVLEALQRIPYGHTRSYSDIAQAIGKPKAVRAVGAANARNPLPVVIPCHRVIGKDGSLTGFGGGLPTKRYLLNLERRCMDEGSATA